ncbi:sulfatase-like hydrolase/transferase [Flavitalea sp.]|nr:sulfatase-like hydrolase/transferase [Flavitalea sp.]
MKRERFSKFFFQQGLIAVIIIYFAFHGYVVHFGSVPQGSLMLLSLALLAIGIITQRFFYRIFRNEGKATLYTAILLLIVLFFGVFQDIISGLKPIANFGRLTLFFPFSLLIIIACFFAIKRSASTFSRFRIFLTTLVIIYILVDLFALFRLTGSGEIKQGKNNNVVIKAPFAMPRPSVYLLLLDEYLGNEGLYSYYHYPNSKFKQKLLDQRFHIISNPSSNYNLTIYSMASMLNMEYLRNAVPAVISNHYAYKQALQAIDKNKISAMFRQMGYRVINKSPFYFDGHVPAYSSGLLPDKINLAQHQTMYYRVAKALPEIMAEKFGFRYFAERNTELADESNNLMMNEVLRETAMMDDGPSLTYLHLMMPHEPLVRDSLGNKLGLTNYGSSRDAAKVDAAYLQYLVYSNNKVGQFIDSLKSNTSNKAIILLMSDHGSRHLARKVPSYAYNNLLAIYLPSGNYEAWYPALTNVNVFPILFNTVFGVRVPLLKDSIVR